jgi:hypothetical protein
LHIHIGQASRDYLYRQKSYHRTLILDPHIHTDSHSVDNCSNRLFDLYSYCNIFCNNAEYERKGCPVAHNTLDRNGDIPDIYSNLSQALVLQEELLKPE